MSQTIEEVADEYQTYRFLSDDDDFDFYIEEILTTDEKIYLGITANETEFYLPFSKRTTAPAEELAIFDAITHGESVSPNTLIGEKITLHISESLTDAVIKSDTIDYSTSITDERPTGDLQQVTSTSVSSSIDTDWWDEFDKACAVSYWYYTTDDFGDGSRETQIATIETVSDDNVIFTIEAGRVRPTVKLPIPENADTDSDRSAEFIEDCSGDIRLLSGETVIALPNTSSVKRGFDGFEVESGTFCIYSPPQFEEYVSEYTPPSQSTPSTSTSSPSPRRRDNHSGRLLKGGTHMLVQFAIFKIFFAPILIDYITAANIESAQAVVNLVNHAFGMIAALGFLAVLAGITMRFQPT